MRNKPLPFLLVCCLLVAFWSCEKTPAELAEESVISKYLNELVFAVAPSSSGLYFWEDSLGTGSVVQPGDTIVMHYSGKVLTQKVGSDYLQFLSTPDEEPYQYIVGQTVVLESLAEGFAKLRPNVYARMVIPSKIGYADTQVGVVPPNSPLLFTVHVLEVKRHNP